MAFHFNSSTPEHTHNFVSLAPTVEPVPAIGFPLFANSLHASKRQRCFSSSPLAVPPAMLDTTLSLSSSNPLATPPCLPYLPNAPCEDNTNAALPFLAILRRSRVSHVPQVPRIISGSPLQRSTQPPTALPAAFPVAVPCVAPARCPVPPVEALRRALKRSHAAAHLDEEVTSRPREVSPCDHAAIAGDDLASNAALAAGAAALGLPPVLPSDADVAERLVKYDKLTASLRGSLPPANLAQWDMAVTKLRERVAMKEEFGNDVNGFLVFLHAQLGSQQPSARRALRLFAAFKQAQKQNQNARVAEASEAAHRDVSRVKAPASSTLEIDDDTASVCSNSPDAAGPAEPRANHFEPRANHFSSSPSSSVSTPSTSGRAGDASSQQQQSVEQQMSRSLPGIDVTCPAVLKKMLFELQTAVVQLEANAVMDARVKTESLFVLRTAQSHLISRLASVVRSV